MSEDEIAGTRTFHTLMGILLTLVVLVVGSFATWALLRRSYSAPAVQPPTPTSTLTPTLTLTLTPPTTSTPLPTSTPASTLALTPTPKPASQQNPPRVPVLLVDGTAVGWATMSYENNTCTIVQVEGFSLDEMYVISGYCDNPLRVKYKQ
jgi:hypothetical protein